MKFSIRDDRQNDYPIMSTVFFSRSPFLFSRRVGIAPSNNFLGLPPPPYSMSALKNGFPLLPSSSNTDTYASSASVQNNNQQQQSPLPAPYSYRKNSRSFVDLNHLEQHSGGMRSSSPIYRSSSPFSVPKPSLFHQTREKERFELSTLNDKFADYVEKVRYLEAQNKKIQLDSSLLTERQQEGCQRLKSIFEAEMKQVKEVVERIFKDKASMVITVKDAQVSFDVTRLIDLFVSCRTPFPS